MSDFGIWAMIGFWASAIGGIAMAILWAKSRNVNPLSRQQLEDNLKKRLDSGELSQSDYEKRILGLGND